MAPAPATPSDEVLDLIGAIAMHRQAMERESGAGPARTEALRKLNELLARERDTLQSHGPGGRHAANIAALVLEIEKLKKSEASSAPAGYARRNPQLAQPNASRTFGRHKGRRTMGRSKR